MQIIKEVDGFYDLLENSWSGAIDTLKDISNADLEDEFMNYLEEMFCDTVPTDGELNDFIWFEREMIYEALGLDENGEIRNIPMFDLDRFMDDLDEVMGDNEEYEEERGNIIDNIEDNLVECETEDEVVEMVCSFINEYTYEINPRDYVFLAD